MLTVALTEDKKQIILLTRDYFTGKVICEENYDLLIAKEIAEDILKKVGDSNGL